MYPKLTKIAILDKTDPALSIKHIKLVTAVFKMLEDKDLADFSMIMNPKLKIYKNNQVWNYHQVWQYAHDANKKYKKIKLLPLQMTITNGNYVTAKYIEKLYPYKGSTQLIKFISIFEIKNNQIYRVWELAVPSQ